MAGVATTMVGVTTMAGDQMINIHNNFSNVRINETFNSSIILLLIYLLYINTIMSQIEVVHLLPSIQSIP